MRITINGKELSPEQYAKLQQRVAAAKQADPDAWRKLGCPMPCGLFDKFRSYLFPREKTV